MATSTSPIDDYIEGFPPETQQVLEEMRGIAAFKDEIKQYKSAKGSVQFPLSEPMPWDLIRRMVQFRLDESTGTRSE